MKTKWPILLGLLFLAAPTAAQAQDAYSTNTDGSIYTYTTNADGSANVAAYAGPPWAMVIPTNINGLLVTSIGGSAFLDCTSLTSVTIPGSVANIWGEAFWACTGLTSVTISNGVTSIGPEAFRGCTGLTSVTIPNGVTSIGEEAFYDCTGLTSVYFEGNAPTADSSVFAGDNNLTVYYLPGTTGWDAFSANTGLSPVLWISPPKLLVAGAERLAGAEVMQLTWTNNGSTCLLESAGALAGSWSTVSTPWTTNAGWVSTTATNSSSVQFYRLRAH